MSDDRALSNFAYEMEFAAQNAPVRFATFEKYAAAQMLSRFRPGKVDQLRSIYERWKANNELLESMVASRS